MSISVKKYYCSCVIVGGEGGNDPTLGCDFGQQVRKSWEALK